MADADEECPAEEMDAEDLLYILYSSGSTGKPKGIVHTTGGYLTHVKATTKWVMDLKDDDVYWCTADIGWVTGHSYIVYGPLSNGATTLMFEGTPTYPESDRWWQVIEDHKVNIFYTAPTAIRAFMKGGTEALEKHDLSSACGCSGPSASPSTRGRGSGTTRTSAEAGARSWTPGGRRRRAGS